MKAVLIETLEFERSEYALLMIDAPGTSRLRKFDTLRDVEFFIDALLKYVPGCHIKPPILRLA